MPYWRLLYHIVWATAKREPRLTGEVAKLVERSIRAGCLEPELVLHALSVMPDHVHLAVAIPPKLSVSSVVGKLKGSASHLVNHSKDIESESRFAWQAEYGALSFGSKALPAVVAYVENQQHHHADHHLWTEMERSDDRK